MLGKLIKYDLKSSAKLFLLIHGIFLVFCVIFRFFYMDKIVLSIDNEMLILSLTLFITLFSLLVSALMFFTLLQIAFRYYRNLFSREGYLSWTLPVSGIQHLWAKLISGYILLVADTLIIAGGILFLVTGENITSAYSLIADEATAALGMSLSRFSLLLLIFYLISCVFSVIMIYFCITVGQLFPGHRVLCAIAAYFITSTVTQAAVLILMFVLGYFPGTTSLTGKDFSFTHYITEIYIFTGIISFIISAAMYIVTHYIMKKKINLI